MAPNLGGCLTCVKYCLFVFNFIFWMLGCGLVGVGIWVVVDAKRFLQVYNTNVSEDIRNQVGVIDEGIVQAAGIAIIVIGGVIMISGFLGCCGAIRESQAMLTMFFIILFLIFSALIAIGAVAIARKDWVKDMLGKAMTLEGNSTLGKTGNSLLSYGYKTYGCCGVNDLPNGCDKAYPPMEVVGTTGGFPCAQNSPGCAKGCLNVIWGVMSQMAVGAGIAALGAGGLILLGMMLSMCLCCAIRNR